MALWVKCSGHSSGSSLGLATSLVGYRNRWERYGACRNEEATWLRRLPDVFDGVEIVLNRGLAESFIGRRLRPSRWPWQR